MTFSACAVPSEYDLSSEAEIGGLLLGSKVTQAALLAQSPSHVNLGKAFNGQGKCLEKCQSTWYRRIRNLFPKEPNHFQCVPVSLPCLGTVVKPGDSAHCMLFLLIMYEYQTSAVPAWVQAGKEMGHLLGRVK